MIYLSNTLFIPGLLLYIISAKIRFVRRIAFNKLSRAFSSAITVIILTCILPIWTFARSTITNVRLTYCCIPKKSQFFSRRRAVDWQNDRYNKAAIVRVREFEAPAVVFYDFLTHSKTDPAAALF